MESKKTVKDVIMDIVSVINTLDDQKKANQIAELLGTVFVIHERTVTECLRKQ